MPKGDWKCWLPSHPLLQSDQVLLVHLLETVLPTLEIFLNSKPLILFYNLVGKGFVFLYHREKH